VDLLDGLGSIHAARDEQRNNTRYWPIDWGRVSAELAPSSPTGDAGEL
jgi:hypothetical protein